QPAPHRRRLRQGRSRRAVRPQGPPRSQVQGAYQHRVRGQSAEPLARHEGLPRSVAGCHQGAYAMTTKGQRYSLDRVEDVEQLEDLLSEPTGAAVETMARLEGDLILLGVGGNMGPTLAR